MTQTIAHVLTHNADRTFEVHYLGTVYALTDGFVILEDVKVRHGWETEWTEVERFRLVTIERDNRFNTVRLPGHTDHTDCDASTCAVMHAMHFDALLTLPAGHSAR